MMRVGGLSHLGPAAALLLLLPAPAGAQEEKPQPIDGTISVVEDRLTLDADVSALLIRRLDGLLADGLPHTVRIRTTLLALDPGGARVTEPLSLSLRTCRLVYDLWGERYAVRVREGEDRIERWADTVAGAARICGTLEDVTLSPVGELDLRRDFRVSLRVDVDPRNGRPEETGRPYLGDPLAAGGPSRPGGTFFGAMARAFYREEEEAEAPAALFESPVFGEQLIRAALGEEEGPGAGEEEAPAPEKAAPPPPGGKEGEEE
ncbi:MAG: hypothetical protein P1V51_23995 [Deltaproteobacteria bacterium]|nr:hypothetical protein [Deltaproteobacteria bacterium]